MEKIEHTKQTEIQFDDEWLTETIVLELNKLFP